MVNENRVDELEMVMNHLKLDTTITVADAMRQLETFLLDLKIYQAHYRDNMKRQQAKGP